MLIPSTTKDGTSRRPRFRTLLALCAVLGATAFLLLATAGCFKRETAVEIGNRTQVLHRGMGPEPADLDPQLATVGNDYHVIGALFEGLVAEDPVDLHPVPGVAERWNVSPDGLTYTFHLRANARWSNGDPVTAQDFIASYRRMLTPALAAENAQMFFIVAGAEAFYKGALTDFAQTGFAAPDARTVRITLEHPAAYFLSLLQHWAWFPVHLPSIEKIGDPTKRTTPWARPGTLVGNGPFVLKTWTQNDRIVVTKSPTYWDAATVKLTEIHLYPIADRDTEERAFRAGQLHVTEALPPGKIQAYRDDPKAAAFLRIDPLVGTEFYRLNVTRPFLNDRRIRRALSLAIDRAKITDNILKGGQVPATTFTPPDTAGYRAEPGTRFDPAEARKLLAEAGYPEGKGAPAVELLFNTSETHRLVAEAAQDMWRRELGLTVKLSNQENTSLRAARRVGAFEMLRSVWTADYLDPATFLGVWTGDSGNNYTGWRNAAYDQLLYQAERTPDQTERYALMKKAEALLLEESPLVPIYHYTHVFLLQPSVKGWSSNLLDHHPYKHVSLEP